MKGYVHSLESMGLNDGIGIRYIVFLQGCNLRCAYCHNPDTWDMDGGMEVYSDKLIKKIVRFKPYFDKTDGGVTISGGDPLLQPDFTIDLLKRCRDEGINTCLDTSGFGIGRYGEILEHVDMILLDIKASSDQEYRRLTGGDINQLYRFIDCINDKGILTRVRHVVIPGINDTKDSLEGIIDIATKLNNLESIELLPYHTLGVNKYKELGMKYRLEGVKPLDDSILESLEQYRDERLKVKA